MEIFDNGVGSCDPVTAVQRVEAADPSVLILRQDIQGITAKSLFDMVAVQQGTAGGARGNQQRDSQAEQKMGDSDHKVLSWRGA